MCPHTTGRRERLLRLILLYVLASYYYMCLDTAGRRERLLRSTASSEHADDDFPFDTTICVGLILRYVS